MTTEHVTNGSGVSGTRMPSRHANSAQTVVFTAPSGGLGLTTLASMFALHISQAGRTTALVDLDIHEGGLDVILGIEGESGLRMSEISAPLGHLSGEALCLELPHWEGMPVLAADPWNTAARGDGSMVKAWEIKAAVDAMTQMHDLVVIDAGCAHGCADSIADYGLSNQLHLVMLVEMSVLGMARAKHHLTRLIRQCGQEQVLVVGMHPHLACSQSVRMNDADAKAYLQMPIADAMLPRRALSVSIVQGLGIASIPKEYRTLLATIERDTVGRSAHKLPSHVAETSARNRRFR
ncbi:hypothetical protein [Bifidobacterium aquikefiricola]|uniref:Uncharacterized protein n=1 Tax=Bifidobacterium aquikefiricola TaxID=3059038 RepID=A0AB39U7Z9_9BIFI